MGLGTKKMGACVCSVGFFWLGGMCSAGQGQELTLSKLLGATKAQYHTILEHSRASNKKRKKKEIRNKNGASHFNQNRTPLKFFIIYLKLYILSHTTFQTCSTLKVIDLPCTHSRSY